MKHIPSKTSHDCEDRLPVSTSDSGPALGALAAPIGEQAPLSSSDAKALSGAKASGGDPAMVASEEALMTPPEVAARLRVSMRTLSRLLKAGELRCIWIGNQRRFDAKAVAAFERSGARARKRAPVGASTRTDKGKRRPKVTAAGTHR